MPPLQLDSVALNVRKIGDLCSLTDLYTAAGSPANKGLKDWLRLSQTEQFITTAARFLKVEKSHLLKVRRGRGKNGGTWAVEQIALEYAQYLDPALAVLVNQVFIQRLEEEAKPELAISRGQDRARRTWQKRGQSEEWIDKRTVGIAARKAFIRVLTSHGVGGQGFRQCTNAIYTPMFGDSSDVVRHKKGLGPSQPIREHLSLTELAIIGAVESLAAQIIEAKGIRGNGACELVCGRTASLLARAVVTAQKTSDQAPALP